jgi:putative protein-disulfide isomerase
MSAPAVDDGMTSDGQPGLVYVGDPMCSWCWGFAPVIDRIASNHGLGIDVVVGGLRPGPAAQPLNERMEEFLRREWAMIAQRTGQPFDVAILEDLGSSWSYDTETPAMAVVEMRRQSPNETWRLFGRLQRAFYAERIDVTDPGVYPELVGGFDVDPAEFVDRLTADDVKKGAWADFAQARRWGITGFPTLLLRQGGRLHLLAAGYRPVEDIEAGLAGVL